MPVGTMLFLNITIFDGLMQVTPTVNDVGGVDEILEMTATVVQNTVPKWVTDQLTVVDNKDGTFTVTKVG